MRSSIYTDSIGKVSWHQVDTKLNINIILTFQHNLQLDNANKMWPKGVTINQLLWEKWRNVCLLSEECFWSSAKPDTAPFLSNRIWRYPPSPIYRKPCRVLHCQELASCSLPRSSFHTSNFHSFESWATDLWVSLTTVNTFTVLTGILFVDISSGCWPWPLTSKIH